MTVLCTVIITVENIGPAMQDPPDYLLNLCCRVIFVPFPTTLICLLFDPIPSLLEQFLVVFIRNR